LQKIADFLRGAKVLQVLAAKQEVMVCQYTLGLPAFRVDSGLLENL
jgi:hypothetical protein